MNHCYWLYLWIVGRFYLLSSCSGEDVETIRTCIVKLCLERGREEGGRQGVGGGKEGRGREVGRELVWQILSMLPVCFIGPLPNTPVSPLYLLVSFTRHCSSKHIIYVVVVLTVPLSPHQRCSSPFNFFEIRPSSMTRWSMNSAEQE